VGKLFSEIERYLFLLKQVVHVGANNSQLLLFFPKVEMLGRLLSSSSTVPHADSCLHPEQVAHQECLVDSCWQKYLLGRFLPMVVPLILEV
jgi:hypothetical protein